jgi:hypothetical protein
MIEVGVIEPHPVGVIENICPGERSRQLFGLVEMVRVNVEHLSKRILSPA